MAYKGDVAGCTNVVPGRRILVLLRRGSEWDIHFLDLRYRDPVSHVALGHSSCDAGRDSAVLIDMTADGSTDASASPPVFHTK
jgi:hypothetical protein